MTNTQQQQLTQGTNGLEVIGYLIENNLEVKKTRDGLGTYVRGRLTVRTGENEDHILEVFEMSKTKSGNENSAFTSITTAMKNMKSLAEIVAEMDEEELAELKIEELEELTYLQANGHLAINDYFDLKTNKLVSYPQLKARYLSTKQGFDNNGNKRPSKAEFKVSGIIDKLNEKEENGEPVLDISLLVPDWRGQIEPMDFVVRDPQGVEAISSMFGVGEPFFITSGMVRNFFKEEQVVKEAMWGAPEVTTVRKALREWQVKGMTRPEGTNYEDNPELVRDAKNAREQFLATLEPKARKRQNAQNDTQEATNPFEKTTATTPAANNDPFAVNTNAKTKTEEVPVEAFEELGDLFG